MTVLQSGNGPVPVLYMDDDVLVIDKPAGVPVFTAPGQLAGTASQIILDAGIALFDGPETELPGVVHRLDKETSGTLALARSERGWTSLKKQIKSHTMGKGYVALVCGRFQERHGVINVPIGAVRSHGLLLRRADSAGRPAVTMFHVVHSFRQPISLLRLSIQTGRTHQIRVHCSYIGHPIVGDYTYGYETQQGISVSRQMLHAFLLSFVAPGSGMPVQARAPLPGDMMRLLEALAERK